MPCDMGRKTWLYEKTTVEKSATAATTGAMRCVVFPKRMPSTSRPYLPRGEKNGRHGLSRKRSRRLRATPSLGVLNRAGRARVSSAESFSKMTVALLDPAGYLDRLSALREPTETAHWETWQKPAEGQVALRRPPS